ncbi:Short chain dehydrogenase [Aspergillus sp. HF37]|nr:Short chain dehydrogenase [Aspergillus sp. HF37]
MPYSLHSRNVLRPGSLVAQKFASEGSNLAINYVSSSEAADTLASDLQAQYKVKAVVVQGDAGLQEDCKRVVKETIDQLGGLDVVVSNAGWTKMTAFNDLDAMSDEDWDKCWSTNVKGNLYLFREALPTFNANPDGGSFIITSSTAAVTAAGSSMAYAVSKAAGLHLMKCLAQTQGNKVRVNAVLPGLLLTDWGQRFPADKVKAYEGNAVLNKVPELEDTANTYVMLAKNTSITGQSIQIGQSLECLGAGLREPNTLDIAFM